MPDILVIGLGGDQESEFYLELQGLITDAVISVTELGVTEPRQVDVFGSPNLFSGSSLMLMVTDLFKNRADGPTRTIDLRKRLCAALSDAVDQWAKKRGIPAMRVAVLCPEFDRTRDGYAESVSEPG